MLILLGLMMIPLIAMVGLAVDSSRAYLAKARLSQAIDAAALAGGRSFHEDYRDEDVQRFFAANFPSDYMDVNLSPLTITFDDEEGTVTVVAQASVPTTFMKLLSIDQVDISARAVVNGLNRGLELALVLDVTGSMGGSKIASLKTAVSSLLDILYGDRETVENLWVAVVPFSGRVNFSPHDDWLDTGVGWGSGGWGGSAGAGWGGGGGWGGGSWDGCGDPRSGDQATNDDPPSVELWQEYDGSGCPDSNILPLTAELTTISDKVQSLAANGNTRTDIGMVWGWRVLSPQWRGLWGEADLPLDYDTENMDKAVIIMTDGQNTPEYGEGTSSQADARLAQECEDMKDAGIIIYTITFQAPSSLDPLYEACASQPSYHYTSPTEDDLEQAFKTIGAQLSQLRIAQ